MVMVYDGDGGQIHIRGDMGARKALVFKQITLACAHSASATLGLPPLTVHAAFLPTLLRLYVAPLGTIHGRPWASCTSHKSMFSPDSGG